MTSNLGAADDLFIAAMGVLLIFQGIHHYRGDDGWWMRLFGRRSATCLIPVGVGMILMALAVPLGIRPGGPFTTPYVAVVLALMSFGAFLFFADPDWAVPPRNRRR